MKKLVIALAISLAFPAAASACKIENVITERMFGDWRKIGIITSGCKDSSAVAILYHEGKPVGFERGFIENNFFTEHTKVRHFDHIDIRLSR